MDQAHALRQLVSDRNRNGSHPGTPSAHVITVCSGKGGVGKSNFTLNFALALKELGKRVLLFDADIGMANIDVLMGVNPAYNLTHLLSRQADINQVIQLGPGGLPFIAGGSGMEELFSLSETDLDYFTSQIGEIADQMDYILFDTGAGLSKETMKFIVSANEVFVVTTPEPTAITDAYALIKVVYRNHPDVSFKLVINQAQDRREAESTGERIRTAASRFLNLDVPVLGYISSDPQVVQAVKRQVPFTKAFPAAAASKDLTRLAYQYLAIAPLATPKTQGIKEFIGRWLNRGR